MTHERNKNVPGQIIDNKTYHTEADLTKVAALDAEHYERQPMEFYVSTTATLPIPIDRANTFCYITEVSHAQIEKKSNITQDCRGWH